MGRVILFENYISEQRKYDSDVEEILRMSDLYAGAGNIDSMLCSMADAVRTTAETVDTAMLENAEMTAQQQFETRYAAVLDNIPKNNREALGYLAGKMLSLVDNIFQEDTVAYEDFYNLYAMYDDIFQDYYDKHRHLEKEYVFRFPKAGDDESLKSELDKCLRKIVLYCGADKPAGIISETKHLFEMLHSLIERFSDTP